MKTKEIVICITILITGIFLGWLLFGGRTSAPDHDVSEHAHSSAEAQVWTCSMHPQIRQDQPGKCPICAMDLIPLKTSGSISGESIDTDAVMLSKEAAALANIQTTRVSRSNPLKELRLYGTIQANQSLLRSQTSHVSGRIEKLFINFDGESVRAGQVIATIYSPDLLNAQQELLEAVKMKATQPALLAAAREKLRLWKLTDPQIAAIEQSGKASSLIDIEAETNGVVVDKKVEQGDYVNQGSVLFDLADLSSVWAVFDAYEADIPYLKTGDRVEYTLQALPGKVFSGRISFIDPILDRMTRTVKVRVETANTEFQLKPEMYATAIVKASLKQHADEVVIPKTAVLWTGKRSIVYVKQPAAEKPFFTLREIELGPSLGDSYVVLSGIDEGEEVVTSGVFSIDASAQLEGKRSMMNNEAMPSVSGHTGQDIPEKGRQQTKHGMLKVEGLCNMCKERIETAAKSVSGVLSASWDADSNELHVNYDGAKTSPDAIAKAVAKSGHDADKYKADDKVYNALPGCCKYRK